MVSKKSCLLIFITTTRRVIILSKKGYVLNLLLGFMIGLLILPSLLEWLGFPFSFADVLELVFGEPNGMNRIIVIVLLVIFLFFAIRNFYRQYKKLT